MRTRGERSCRGALPRGVVAGLSLALGLALAAPAAQALPLPAQGLGKGPQDSVALGSKGGPGDPGKATGPQNLPEVARNALARSFVPVKIEREDDDHVVLSIFHPRAEELGFQSPFVSLRFDPPGSPRPVTILATPGNDNAVPEPGVGLLLAGAGLAGLVARMRRRRA